MIELRDITFRYPSKREPSLKGINLRLEREDYVLLKGYSGSGKSTLFKVINGIIPHLIEGEFSGSIRYSGGFEADTDISGKTFRIGTVFQNADYQLLSNFVYEEAPENDRGRILFHSLLVRFGMAHFIGRRINTLSSGEKQKIALCAVLAAEPELLLLDEPETNLDNHGIITLCEILNELKAQTNTTVLLTAKRIDAFRQFFAKVFRLESGVLSENPEDKFDATPSGWERPGPAGDDPILEADRVSYSHGGGRLLENVSLAIRRGEIIGLQGANGSGKTTLASIISGYVKADSGQIRFRGTCGRNGSVSCVYQNPLRQVFCGTVKEEVEFASNNYNMQTDGFTEKVMRLLDIEKLRDQEVLTLSYGELERTVIAASLSHQPSFIILDEPTIGQDAVSIGRLYSLIVYMQKRGGTFLIISHNRDFLHVICHRIFHLMNGKLEEISTHE